MHPTILPAGDSAFVFQLGTQVSADVNTRIIALADALAAHCPAGITEVVPTYRSLMICYDPEIARGAALAQTVSRIYETLDGVQAKNRRVIVPCVYGGEVGQDLEELAQMKGMTPEQVIALHSGAEYRVYMIGFAPGFAYLGGLPEQLHTPRLKTPRQYIPAGALGIGGQQASISSVAGPSGWRFVGWTPVRAFAPETATPFVFRAGDRIRFRAVDAAEGQDLLRRQSAGESIVAVEWPDA